MILNAVDLNGHGARDVKSVLNSKHNSSLVIKIQYIAV